MKIRSLISTIAMVTLLSSGVHATDKVGAAFLKINPSARLAALGSTGAAMAEGASSLFVNPAAAGVSRSAEILMTHSQGMVDTSFDALGFVLPIQSHDSFVLGVSAIRLVERNFDGRGENREKTGSFAASDTLLGLSIAKGLGSNFSLGMTIKGIQEKIADESASGAALDIGIVHKAAIRGLSLGLSASNLGGKMKFMNEDYSLPATATLGVGYQFHGLLVSADAAQDIYSHKTNFGMGIECFPGSPLTLRMGYMSDVVAGRLSSKFKTDSLSQMGGFGAGLGLRLGRFQLDYALLPHQSLDQTHRLSLSAKFGQN